MAVLPSSSSPVEAVSSKINQESLKRAHDDDAEGEPKRAKCPGVRIKGNRIYDSTNGSTCHQCRQKTRDFVASCKNQKERNVCPIKFCHKCLLNRYGENADEVERVSDWQCPKCRGICNCSYCMKKKGCKPTGQLAFTAKACGFSSVYAMLKGKGSGNIYINPINGGCGQDPEKNAAISSMKTVATDKEKSVSSLADHQKENFIHVKNDLSSKHLKANVNSLEKLKKVKRVELKELRNGTKADEPHFTRSSAKKSKVRKEVREEAERIENDSTLVEENKKLFSSPESDVRRAEKLGFDKNAKNIPVSLSMVTNPNQKPNVVSSKEIINDAVVSHKRPVTPNKEFGVHHVGKRRKDNSVNAEKDPAQKKVVPKELGTNQVGILRKENSSGAISDPKWKGNISECILTFDISSLCATSKDVKEEVYGGTCKGGTNLDDMQNYATHAKSNTTHDPEKVNTATTGCDLKEVSIEIPLPLGFPLTNISGFELAPEDIGDALQLLEFCAVFGKALNLRKGEAEAVLRELIRARAGRLTQGSFATSVVQFHVKLISVILKDKGKMSRSLNTDNGRDAWVKALNDLISGSDFGLKQFQLDALDKGIDYQKLTFSKKLRLLNFLCDESLATKKLRSWIDNQNMKFVEQEKKERSKIQAARCEEKRLKQNMLDEVAAAITSKNAPLSIQEHDAVVSKLKIEVDRAHAQLLEAKRKLLNRSQISDAIRTEPVFSDAHGRRFWELKCYDDENAILLQDIKEANERWSSYGAEQKNDIQLYCYSTWKKRQRIHGAPHSFSIESIQTNL